MSNRPSHDRLIVSVGGFELSPDSIRSFYLIEGTNMPFPVCHLSFQAFDAFNFVTGMNVGNRFVISLVTGESGDMTDGEYEIVQVRESNTGTSVFSVIGFMCNASSITARQRRAFSNMTSKDVLLSLYEEDRTFEAVHDETGDASFSDSMTWLQTGTWVNMWADVLTHSWVGEDDSVLAFSNIDGEAVVTTIKTILSEKPRVINLDQRGEGFGYLQAIRDTNHRFVSGVSRHQITEYDFVKGILTTDVYSGVHMMGFPDKKQSMPVASHVFDGTAKHHGIPVSPNVHKNWAKAQALNEKMSEIMSGNIALITAYPTDDLRIGEVIELDGSANVTNTRLDGTWIVTRILWDMTEDGFLCHATLARPTIGHSEIDEKD